MELLQEETRQGKAPSVLRGIMPIVVLLNLVAHIEGGNVG